VAVASAGPYANLHYAQTDNHVSTPPLKILQAGCPSCRPTNSVKALKAITMALKCTVIALGPWDRQTDRQMDSWTDPIALLNAHPYCRAEHNEIRQENISSPIDTHVHAGRTFDNHVTLTFYILTSESPHADGLPCKFGD